MTEIKPNADFVSPPATPAGSTPENGVQNSELRKLVAVLTTGEEGLAKRKDLTELHKRIVAMFTTLNQGLVEGQSVRAQEDRAQLIQRLDEVERAVNSMEGALRIELEPLIRNVVAAAVSKIDNKPRKSALGLAWVSLILGGAVLFGAYYNQQILSFATQIPLVAGLESPQNSTKASPIGGIPQP
jgi:hypothetical protein